MSRQAYIEITIVGDYARVAAIDPETGAEAIVLGPAFAARADLERLALAKLEHLLQREAEAPGASGPPTKRPGRIV